VDRARGFDYDELYPDEDSLGTCPCEEKRPVYERAWFYRCPESGDSENDCEFRIWKDKAGRYMDRTTVGALLEKRETPVLDHFLTRDGRSYRGVLKIEGRELKLTAVSEAEGDRIYDQPEYEVNEDPLGTCPACTQGSIIETPTEYVCTRREAPKEDEKGCPFVLARTACKREITRDEALPYVTNGRTELLTEFISRYGRPFSAVLFLKANGRHGFEFPPRTGKKGSAKKKGTSKKKGTKKTTRKKATRKKSTSDRKKSTTRRKKTAAPKRKRSGTAARSESPSD
ncbi:MAG: topoisomerase C-terminal repeat-containing protein, partial [Myxococcota bacterium]